jgi:hypothetical protein
MKLVANTFTDTHSYLGAGVNIRHDGLDFWPWLDGLGNAMRQPAPI